MKLSPPVHAGDHADGAADAPVTLVQYGDYECSHCGRAYPIVKAIRRALGARLRFVFRNYPLVQIHRHALHAAEAAEGAALQDQFWAMHDLLHERQRALDDAHLIGYASQLGLEPARFARDASSAAVRARIQADIAGADRSEISGTPAFFINGVRHDDGWDHDTLLAALQAAGHAARR